MGSYSGLNGIHLLGRISLLIILEVPMSSSPKILKSIVKSVLVVFGIVAVLYILGGLYSYFGPGIGVPIINGYEYTDAGGYERMITDQSRVVIDARVDGYKIEGDKIIVARRPRVTFYEGNQDQVLSSRLSGDCEYWAINIKTHRVEKSSEAHGLHCN